MTRVAAAVSWPAYVCWTYGRGYCVKLGAHSDAEFFDHEGNQIAVSEYDNIKVVAELGLCESVDMAVRQMNAKWRPVGYVRLYLAHYEWGNELMRKVAQEWFDTHPDCEFVHVTEHAGWHLGFRRDGSVWSTANDMAHMDDGPVPTLGCTCYVRRGEKGQEVLS